MAKKKGNENVEQKVKIVNKNSKAVTEIGIGHANNLFAYHKKHGNNCWEFPKDSEYEYHEKDGIIKKSNPKPS